MKHICLETNEMLVYVFINFFPFPPLYKVKSNEKNEDFIKNHAYKKHTKFFCTFSYKNRMRKKSNYSTCTKLDVLLDLSSSIISFT